MSTSGGGGLGSVTSSSPSTSGLARTNVSVTSINCTADITAAMNNTMLPLNAVMTSSPPTSSSISSSSSSPPSNGTVINAPTITATSVVTTTNTPPTDAVNLHTNSNNSNNNGNINNNSSNISNSNSSSSNSISNNQASIEQQQQPSALLNNGSNHFYGNGSIRISVPKMEESDESETELSNIENTASSAVSLRTDNMNKNAPRPMSWEGELSDNDERMESESSSNLEPLNSVSDQQMNVIAYASNCSTTPKAMESTDTAQLISKEAIKPEYVEYGTGGDSSTSIKCYPIDMSSVKYEPGLPSQTQIPQQLLQHQQQDAVNSPLLTRSKNNLLPANPSPDSAIHSVYTHSSPSQSPLTSRHTPYTPSLSRNNSDASYSSCYSYSSEFSPTHSPIQGRHNMYNSGNFNGSPLHHSVLYKPMIEGESIKLQQLQTHEDNLIETEAIPSAGISRQQLINR